MRYAEPGKPIWGIGALGDSVPCGGNHFPAQQQAAPAMGWLGPSIHHNQSINHAAGGERSMSGRPVVRRACVRVCPSLLPPSILGSRRSCVCERDRRQRVSERRTESGVASVPPSPPQPHVKVRILSRRKSQIGPAHTTGIALYVLPYGASIRRGTPLV